MQKYYNIGYEYGKKNLNKNDEYHIVKDFDLCKVQFCYGLIDFMIDNGFLESFMISNMHFENLKLDRIYQNALCLYDVIPYNHERKIDILIGCLGND